MLSTQMDKIISFDGFKIKSNLSQQAYVTKTGIPMFVLGMFQVFTVF